MSFFDFNNAQEQMGGELIPAKTLAKVVCAIRPGGHGEHGWLTKSDSGFEYLNLELTICSEPMTRRKIFQNAGVGGVTDGHKKAAEITRAMLRAALESARGINPKDESDKARAARQVQGFEDFSEMEFAVEIGIEKDKTGQYPDKNKIQRVITPDHKDYQRIMSGETIIPAGVKAPVATAPAPDPAPWQQATPPPPQQQQDSAIPAWAR